jgi:hypothetical protein
VERAISPAAKRARRVPACRVPACAPFARSCLNDLINLISNSYTETLCSQAAANDPGRKLTEVTMMVDQAMQRVPGVT